MNPLEKTINQQIFSVLIYAAANLAILPAFLRVSFEQDTDGGIIMRTTSPKRAKRVFRITVREVTL